MSRNWRKPVVLSEQDVEMRRLYGWSFVLRVAAGLVAWVLTMNGVVELLADALYYEQVGWLVAQDWLAGHNSIWLDSAVNNSRGTEAWLIVGFVAVVYWILGGVQALPLLIILYSALTAFTPVLVYRIALQLGAAHRTARIGAWVVAISPAFAFWSGALYKEGLVLLFLCLALLHTLFLQERLRVHSIIIIAVSLLALLGLRAYLSLLLAGVILAGLVLGRTRQTARRAPGALVLRQGLIVLLVIVALVLVGFTGVVQRTIQNDPTVLLRQFQSSREGLASAGSGYLRGTDISTPENALAFLPVGMFYFITVPWPWDLGPLRQQLIIPEVTVWLLLYPLLLVGMLRGLKRNLTGSIVVIAMSIVLCVVYALLVGNIGIAYRLRIQVWVLWAVFLGWGWEWLAERLAIRNQGQRRLVAPK